MKQATMATMLLALLATTIWAEDKPKGEKVEYDTFGPYFEKNTSGLKGDNSYLVLTDTAGFDKIFGSGFTTSAKPKLIPQDTFDKKVVVAAIKRGNSTHEFKVESVTVDKGTLYVTYKATAGKATTATFASSLILTVDKEKLEKIVFVENGKEVETVKIGK